MTVATDEGTIRAFGRTRCKIRCSCGSLNEFYLWSWAGHGKGRCWGCRSWIDYRTLEIVPDTKKAKATKE